jgi:hypothetical protein
LIEVIEKIVEAILKIPALIEFIIGAVLYFMIYWVAGEVVSGVAEETVCKSPGIESWFLCFILTNEVIAFFSIVGVVIGIGMAFRKKFF